MVSTELQVGQKFSFEVQIGEAEIDRFGVLSGDLNPLHMDSAFAQARGFKGRVVHGAYLVALGSRILGMHLPGPNCLLQTIQMKFHAPTYIGTLVRVSAEIDQVSEAVAAAVVKIDIADAASGKLLASGKANVGFTHA